MIFRSALVRSLHPCQNIRNLSYSRFCSIRVSMSSRILNYYPSHSLSDKLGKSFHSGSYKPSSRESRSRRLFSSQQDKTNEISQLKTRSYHKELVSKDFHIYRVNHGFCDVYIVPMFTDNYGYILVDKASGKTACVDPGEPSSIIRALPIIKTFSKETDIQPQVDYILCTHKHSDHVGGNLRLKEEYRNMQIIGTGYEEIPAIDVIANEGSIFTIGNTKVEVMHVPCHTRGHVAFLASSLHDSTFAPILFPGDTLFVGGCGRFFEGTATQMLKNMDRFSSLPSDTAIYCAHEYTDNNYRFLVTIDRERCERRFAEILRCRDINEPTVPSSIGQELQSNLFMLCRDENVQKLLKNIGKPVETMGTLRTLKNNFK